MRLFIILISAFISLVGFSQQKLAVKIKGENDLPVSANILIKGTNLGFSSDSSGIAALFFSSNGNFILEITSAGYEEKQIKISIPYLSDTLIIELESIEHEMEEIIVQSTRTSRTIANVPTRVETISLEEIDEKTNMRPANVAMILHESTGMQVQQTSATSGNASIRIQGLDGRYTQILKDGFPNFGNFSSGLSILEIPPLDLKQVEIIKGPASPLFGGGAIAGVINFISRTPLSRPEYNFIINQSNIGQTNLGAFSSGRTTKLGYTMLALYNRSSAFDKDKDEFTEVPKSNEFTLNPKLFFYPDEKTTITVGNSFTSGERTGGDIHVIKNTADASHQYFERNKTIRNISSVEFDKKLGDKKRFDIKNSFSIFDRTISIPAYKFAGKEYNSFTDVSYVSNGKKHAFVFGGNFIYNHFRENAATGEKRNNTVKTAGLYSQHTWDASDRIKLESGLRIDLVNYKNNLYSNTEAFVLPRISLLIKINSKWSSRIGGGIGYKTPTLFTEESEKIQYQNVEQLNLAASEKSYGGTVDINFRTNISDDLSFSFNQMFFYTSISRPVILINYNPGEYRFINVSNPLRTAGFETNAKFIFRENFKVFLGYTFTDIRATYLPVQQFLPLVPKNKLNTALIYEKEGLIKLGLEGYFTGSQYLTDGSKTPSFSEFGFMAEKIFKNFSLFINFENFTDTRQSRYKGVVNGSHLNPSFDEIWTHTEGFVINGGIKLRF